MAYTLEQIFEALGKADNGGAMVADLQSIISTARNEAAAYRVDRNKVLDALGIRESKNPEESLLNMRTLFDEVRKLGNPESLGGQINTLQNQVKELTDKYAASEEKAKAEHTKRINTAMHAALQAALAKGNALNPDAFVKLLSDQVVVGDDDSLGSLEKWALPTRLSLTVGRDGHQVGNGTVNGMDSYGRIQIVKSPPGLDFKPVRTSTEPYGCIFKGWWR